MMSRQREERSRVLAEMKDRFGENDPMVSQWMGELQNHVPFEAIYPAERRSHPRTVRPTGSARRTAAIDCISSSTH
jgi:hypothetical protein